MNTKTTTLTAFCIIIINSLLLTAQAPYGSAGEHTAVPLGDSEAPFGYYEYLPLDFDTSSGETYPLVISYHGSSSSGNGTWELDYVLSAGLPKLISNGSDLEAIIISPQSTDANFSATDFLSLYNYIIDSYNINTDRVYVTGLSSGGSSTWNALKEHYDKIAAAIPICGYNLVNDPSVFLQQTPIWTFHNFDDSVIDVSRTISNVNRISDTDSSVMTLYPYENGDDAANEDYTMQFDSSTQTWSIGEGRNEPLDNLAFTLYKDGGHNSWTKTYDNQAVLDWLFSQSINTLSISEKTLDFKLYPNPTSGSVTISTKNETEKKIEVYSISGKKVYESSFFRELTVDLSAYSSGVYFAKVVANDSIEKSMKIIIN
ncbi:T9SS type A sorting domain-containing protein [Winogradskyella helgolandensis]|uniref:T9SS type A sorting domain-containing protein n=1 Tax=Winogradskyella helgolandensis TaxID=2697010 RepID=UPI0015CD601C|nr:T9SS type A sorting domain-containing protein [Winogradskyella helgolandensis]